MNNSNNENADFVEPNIYYDPKLNFLTRNKDLISPRAPNYQETTETIIDCIKKANMKIGMFSSRFYNNDDFDNINYSEEEMTSSMINAGELIGYVCPYNLVVFHKDNKWKYDCLNVEFEMDHNVILIKNTNFPQIINIKRSSGKVQKAFIKDNGGFIVKTSKTHKDTFDKFYFRVIFDIDDNTEVKMDNIYELQHMKDISLEDILDVNPDIKELEINHHFFNDTYFENKSSLTESSLRINTLKYYNEKKHEWINKKINPIMERLNDRIKITNNMNM